MHHFAHWARLVQTFCPVTRQPPSSLTARVFSEARSDPASGSEKPWHQISSAERIGSRKRSRCCSVPCAITTGPPITMPSTFAGRGAFARAISSLKIACSMRVAPRPPYSAGHDIPAQPPAWSVRCQSRANSIQASVPLRGSSPGWLSANQARTSSRKAVSSGVSVRSIRRPGIYRYDRLADRVEHDHRGRDPGHAGEDHARVLDEDRGRRASVLAVVDQVQVAEDPV